MQYSRTLACTTIFFSDDGEAEDSTEQQLRSQGKFNTDNPYSLACVMITDTIVAESASLISALTEQIKSKGIPYHI